MNFTDLIAKKKNGKTHTKEEIEFIVKSISSSSVTDAQISAWLMTVCFSGLNLEETVWLTEGLANSGKKVDFGDLKNLVVDKHSTGGVGDKVTITLMPLLAAAGVPIAKLADRGLGIAAGTVDKLESIPGFNTKLTIDNIVEQVKKINCVIASQTDDLAPADKKLQILRNSTCTADSDVLIAASLISKKIAAGANNILLDVKYGSGALMKTPEEAIHLSDLLVKTGKSLDKKIIAVISSMEEPLGRAIGNSIEVIEAIEFLKGNITSGDLYDLTYYFGVQTLLQLGIYDNKCDAEKFLANLVSTGKALSKFKEIVAAQNGDVRVFENYDYFKLPAFKIECEAKKSGYIQLINAGNIAQAAKAIGVTTEDVNMPIDDSVGIYLNKKSGEYVERGEILYTIYSNNEEKTKIAQKYCDDAFVVADTKPPHKNLIYKIIGNEDEDV